MATAADADALAEIEYVLFPENNFNATTLRNEILHDLTWVAHVDELLVGYVLCRMGNGSLLDVLRLGVLPSFRRLGIASQLLKSAMSITGHVMLTVRKGNDPALELYHRHGFQITGTMPQHYSWVMQFRTTSS